MGIMQLWKDIQYNTNSRQRGSKSDGKKPVFIVRPKGYSDFFKKILHVYPVVHNAKKQV